jgi:hypothetical protein
MGRADPTTFTGANVVWMCGVDFQNGLFTPNDTLTAWSFARANQVTHNLNTKRERESESES